MIIGYSWSVQRHRSKVSLHIEHHSNSQCIILDELLYQQNRNWLYFYHSMDTNINYGIN